MAFTEPIVGLFTLHIGINFGKIRLALQLKCSILKPSLNSGMLYLFFDAFPYVFAKAYDFDVEQVGLTFTGLLAGVLVGCCILIVFGLTTARRERMPCSKKTCDDQAPPERRLYLAMTGSFLLPPALFLFGWSAQARAHWIFPVIAEAFFGCGNLLMFVSATLYSMDVYGSKFGASALAVNCMVRNFLGAAFPLFGVRLFEALGVGWAASLLGFISLSLVPVPWIFYMYGPRLRAKSKYVSGGS
jgi:hypothetical protein